MLINSIKESFITYFHSFTINDFIAFGWVGIFIVTLLMLVVLLIVGRRYLFAIFLFLISIIVIVVAPFGIKYLMQHAIRKTDVKIESVTKLNFTPSIVIVGSLKNIGKIDFKKCYIRAYLYKSDSDKYKNMLNRLKPLKIETIVLEKDIKKGDIEDFKMVIKNFKFSGDFNTSVEAECY
jgi:hypothetical protein